MVQTERNTYRSDGERGGSSMKYDHIPCAACGKAIPPGDDCIISSAGKAYCAESCVTRLGKRRT